MNEKKKKENLRLCERYMKRILCHFYANVTSKVESLNVVETWIVAGELILI